MTITLSRRRALALAAAAPLAFAPAIATAARADLTIIILSDLHSAYERIGGTLATIDAAIAAAAGAPTLIVINGDVFERGNVVALRSEGRADWAFLEALRRRGPVILNLGNHETALLDDMTDTVREARARGLVVVSNMVDRRTGQPFASAHYAFAAAGVEADVIGIATDEINTYRAPVRPTLDLPAPGRWGFDNLPRLLRPGRLALVLSHGGVVGDREFLPVLPDGALLVGGHEHLRFQHQAGRTRYIHTGSWNRFLTVASVSGISAGAPVVALDQRPVPAGEGEDMALANLIRDMRARHMTDEDRQVVARSSAPLDLGATARRLVAAMARAAGADVGLIGHTTLGTGVPGGEVTRHDMAATIRFDGPLVAASITPEQLARIYERANQDRDIPLDRRIGDFVYANEVPILADRRYAIATNGWTRLNAERYLGSTGLTFAEVSTPPLRALLAGALN